MKHFEARLEALDGKGMIVCMSRRICVALYDAIVTLRPEWHSDDDDAGAIKIVMTGAASDPLAWQAHIGRRPRRGATAIAKRAQESRRSAEARDRARHVADGLRRAVHAHDVCRQAHARPRADAGHRPRQPGVPRQARRAVVDYIGIAQNLKKALGQYTPCDQEQTGIDEDEAVAEMLEKLRDRPRHVPRLRLRPGFGRRAARSGWMHGRRHRLGAALAGGGSGQGTSDEGKKRAPSRYADAVLGLIEGVCALPARATRRRRSATRSAFSRPSGGAREERPASGKPRKAERELAVQQLDQPRCGLHRDRRHPEGRGDQDAGHLDPVRRVPGRSPEDATQEPRAGGPAKAAQRGNCRAVENQRRRSQGVLRAARSGRRALPRQRACQTVEVLNELIELAKDIRGARARGEELGLSRRGSRLLRGARRKPERRQAMGDEKLRVIAHELLEGLRRT